MKRFAVLSLALVLGVAAAPVAGRAAAAFKPQTVQAGAQWAEIYRTPDDLVAGADLIVIAKHVESQPGRVVGTIPFTFNGFQIESVVKGVHDRDDLVVESTGGMMKDNVILGIDDGGPFVPGHRYLLFLKAQGANGVYYQINHQARYEIDRAGMLKGVDPTEPVVAAFNGRPLSDTLDKVERRVPLVAGAAVVSKTNWNGCYKYADLKISWYNGGTGDYFDIYEEEARTDANAWAPYTDVSFTPVATAGTTDHINAYNAAHGATGWLSLVEIQSFTGCTVKSGRLRLNQTYLDNGSYTRNQKKAIACNLIGKILGLTNESGIAGCMDGTLNNPFPSTHDRDTINSIY
jgi:hypothetical protein